MIESIMEKLEKVAVRGSNKKLKPEYDVMLKIKNWVADEKKHARYCRDWTEKEIEVLNKYLFLTSKPMIYLINLSEKDYIRRKNKCRGHGEKRASALMSSQERSTGRMKSVPQSR
ncbi:hypothetical protein J4Q44_G00199810 [Coregonus suidteri]|uniref:Uncharacterized protein n=1 Tax=Coregonus suidteri TaxID=861788 RepID=A0AAN8QNQ0_9TELE